MSKKYLKQSIITLLSLGLIFLANSVVWGVWDVPTQAPPAGNVAAPVNISNVAQSKLGDLSIGPNLKYWITQYYDSFALKNKDGQIKFVVGQDGHIGIGTGAPEGILDVGQENSYTYKVVDLGSVYFSKTPLCACDESMDKEDCVSPVGLNKTFTAVDVGSLCYERYPAVGGGYIGAKCKRQGSAFFARYFNVQNGKLKLGSQTVDGDSAETVATKGYVDGKTGGCPAGYKWYDFAFTGGCFKDGASAEIYCPCSAFGYYVGYAKIRSGVLYTRLWSSGNCDTGWQVGYTARFNCGGGEGIAEVSIGGVGVEACLSAKLGTACTGQYCRLSDTWDNGTLFTGDFWK